MLSCYMVLSEFLEHTVYPFDVNLHPFFLKDGKIQGRVA